MDLLIWKSVVVNLIEKLISLTKKFKNEKQSDAINEVLIYGGDIEERKQQVGLNNLFCILYIIANAGRTIDISIPSLESDSITQCLIDVKRKNNVKIRLVVHNDEESYNLEYLADNGIDVKVIRSKVRLEHEFILIDGTAAYDTVAILGSLDFEVNRVNCSRDTTILSSEYALITALQREFNRVWNSVDDIHINKFNKIDEVKE